MDLSRDFDVRSYFRFGPRGTGSARPDQAEARAPALREFCSILTVAIR